MPSIHSTLGALEVGVLVMLLLFGIMIAQAYAYYQSQSTTDNRILRILVSESAGWFGRDLIFLLLGTLGDVRLPSEHVSSEHF